MAKDLTIIAFVLACFGLGYVATNPDAVGPHIHAIAMVGGAAVIAFIIWLAFRDSLGGSRRVSRGGGR